MAAQLGRVPTHCHTTGAATAGAKAGSGVTVVEVQSSASRFMEGLQRRKFHTACDHH
jgi:hypothetical protein